MAFYQLANHDRRFIAIFSPKCACNTLKHWFADSLGLELGEGEHELDPHRIWPQEIARFASYRKFLFVRNPFDRLVSYYVSFVVGADPRWRFADDAGEVDLSGASFIECVEAIGAVAKSGNRLQHHLEPQSARIEGLVPDRVLATETLDRSLPALARELGFEHAPRRLNANRYAGVVTGFVGDRPASWLREQGSPDPGFFYDEATRRRVEQIYARDLALCGIEQGENPYLPIARAQRAAKQGRAA